MLHAVLKPFAADRWVHCYGSVKAEEQYPNPDTEESREGNAAHEIGATLIRQAAVARHWRLSDFEGKEASNGVIYTDEMFEAAVLYAEDVQKVMRESSVFGGDCLKIEQPVTIPRVHALNWGSPGCSVYDLRRNKLTAFEFKYGHKPVEHFENWQGIDYTIGLVDELTGGNGIADQNLTVEIRIIQPRSYHIDGVCRGWEFEASELRGYANQLKHAAEESQKDDPPCNAGEWCDNCKASRDCTTLQYAAAGVSDRVSALNHHNMHPDHAAIEIRYLRRAKILLDERLDALETQSLEQMKASVIVPGFGIGYGRGSVVWSRPANEIIALGDLVGVNFRKPDAVITPTQANKLDVDEAVIKSYSLTKQGAARLVTTNETIASRVFSNQ